MTTIVWIKNDLRLTDSRSVALALSTTPASDIVVVRAKDGSPSHVRPTERRLARTSASPPTFASRASCARRGSSSSRPTPIGCSGAPALAAVRSSPARATCPRCASIAPPSP
jgi:hypothetical protein